MQLICCLRQSNVYWCRCSAERAQHNGGGVIGNKLVSLTAMQCGAWSDVQLNSMNCLL